MSSSDTTATKFQETQKSLTDYISAKHTGVEIAASDEGVFIYPPGFSLADLSDFFTSGLGNKSLGTYLPKEDAFVLPLDKVSLESLSLTPSEAEEGNYSLSFTLAWNDQKASIAPPDTNGQEKSSSFELENIKAHFTIESESITAKLSTMMKIDDLELEADISLPSLVVDASVHEIGQSGGSVVKNLVPADLQNPPKDQSIELHNMRVMVDIRQKAFIFHLELRHLFDFSPFQLGVLQLDISHSPGDTSVGIYGEIGMDLGEKEAPLIIFFEAEYSSGEKALTLGGGLHLQPGQKLGVGHILESHGIDVPSFLENISIAQLDFTAQPIGETKSFSFHLTIDDVVDLEQFKIEEVSVSVDYESAPSLPTQVNADLKGKASVFGFEFELEARKVSAGTTSEWVLSGHMDSGGKSIGELIEKATGKKDLPAWLNGLTILDLGMEYHTGNKDFSFSCAVDVKSLLGNDTDVQLLIDVELRHGQDANQKTTYEQTITGQMIFDLDDNTKLEFDILFDRSHAATTDTVFIAAYKNLAGGDINIGALTSKLDPNLYIPLSINLKDAFFVYDKKAAASNIMVGMDIGTGINLSNLPLIGKLFPASQTLKLGIQPLFVSGSFTAERLNELEQLIPEGGITLPEKDKGKGVSLMINLQMGDLIKHFDLPIQLAAKTQTKPSQKSIPPAANVDPIGKSLQPASNGSALDGITWFNLQKAFGPVRFNRIGVAYSGGKIHGYLDASMGLGGLTISLDGLGVSTPLQAFHPSFSLNGLGLDYRQGPVEIGGSFVRYHVKEGEAEGAPYDEYDGLAVLKMKMLNVSAFGSYAHVNGQHSLFIYAVINYPIGGPVFFFVRGLAAGFGYNRLLRMPDISQVAQFPLVSEAVGGASAPASDHNSRKDRLQKEIASLRQYITPSAGQYFLAAGIRFTSFKMIDSFVMVAVSFGHHFEIDILGLSTLVIPTPEQGKSVNPIAEAQLALKAVINPDEGVIGIQAQLTQNSFLLSRSCHLTGGFAFFTWFGGTHKGDFVITLGGYHPHFNKPAHYPAVPRVGFNWVISSHLLVKGAFYFALTGHALMAGGSLEALFHLGPIKAWFIIGADFIISWKPYFYEASLYLSMGVSFTFWLFGTHTISVHIGADLHIWGPDFSGKARIHLAFISFSISFGDAAPKPRPISWKTFKDSFLPASDLCHIAVSNGMIKHIKGKDKTADRYIINPKKLLITVNSVIPVSTFVLFSEKSSKAIRYLDKGHQILQPIVGGEVMNTGYATAIPGFGIGPMGIAQVDSSTMNINIKYENGDSVNVDFAFTPILKRMPKALWGDKLRSGINDQSFIENALAGFEIRPAQLSKPGKSHIVRKADLKYSIEHRDKVFQSPAAKHFSSKQQDANLAGVNTTVVMEKRAQLAEALGYNLDELNMNVPADFASIFVKSPKSGELV